MRKPLFLTIAGLAALSLLVAFIVNARRPLSHRSMQALDVLIKGDAGSLIGFASEKEIKEEGLTRDKLQAVLDRLVRPYIDHLDPSTDFDGSDSTGNFNAVSERQVVTKDGRVVPLGAQVWMGDGKPFINVLHTALHASWTLRAFPKGGYKSSSAFFQASVKGLREDRAFLESLGLRGYMPSNATEPFRTWDETLERGEKLARG